MEAAFKLIKQKHPHIKKAIVSTDGAGAFSCLEFALFLGYMGCFTRIRVILHYVSEAGCGKSTLDTHFCYVMKQIEDQVAAGRGAMDFVNAKTAACAIAAGQGISNTTAGYITYNCPSESPSNDDTLKDLSYHLSRTYEYSSTDLSETFIGIYLRRMSFRNGPSDVGLVTRDDLQELRDEPLSVDSCLTMCDETEITRIKSMKGQTFAVPTEIQEVRRFKSISSRTKEAKVEEKINEKKRKLEDQIEISSNKSVYKGTINQLTKVPDRDKAAILCQQVVKKLRNSTIFIIIR